MTVFNNVGGAYVMAVAVLGLLALVF